MRENCKNRARALHCLQIAPPTVIFAATMRSQLLFSTHRLARCFGHRCSIFATTSHENALISTQKSIISMQTRAIHLTSELFFCTSILNLSFQVSNLFERDIRMINKKKIKMKAKIIKKERTKLPTSKTARKKSIHQSVSFIF